MYYIRESDKDEFKAKLLELFKEYNASIDIEFEDYHVKGISIHIMGECGHGWNVVSVDEHCVSSNELEEAFNKDEEEI